MTNFKLNRSRTLFFIIAICGVLLIARQFNTVKERHWQIGRPNETPAVEIRTVNDLFGSYYQGFVNGEDTGVKSKVFEDVGKSIAPAFWIRQTTIEVEE